MKKVACVLFVLISTLLYSQNVETDHLPDSLKAEIKKDGIRTDDLANISKLQRIYKTTNTDSALYYSDMEIAMALQTKDQNAIATARLEKASLLWSLIDPIPAQELLSKNIGNKHLISDTLLAQTYMMLAKVEIQLKMPDRSLQHTIAASAIYIERHDSANVVACFSYVAGIHLFVMQEEEKAIEFFEKAISYNDYKKEQNFIPLYINYSTALSGLDRFEEAISKVELSAALAQKLNITDYDASIYIQYALIYNTMEDYETSLRYTLIADSLVNADPRLDYRTREKIRWYFALNYKELKQYEEAINYLRLLEKSMLQDPWDISFKLIEIYREMGDYENAFYEQEQLIAAIDSINEIERSQKLKEVIEKYENEKNQQQIGALSVEKELQLKQIEQQRFILLGTVVFFVFLISFGFYWYRSRVKLKAARQDMKAAQLQQRFLRTQLNPHFFFHALTSVESYIYENNKEEAASFLHNFSSLMRNILEFSDMDFISLKDDVEFIKKYMKLQQINHDFKFNFEINLSPSLNTEELLVPPMIIQPAVENAILHGALSREGGEVSIDYMQEGDHIKISIRDNGEMGVPSYKSSGKLNRSMSTNITKKRIENFKETYGMQIEYIPITPLAETTGKVAVFSIPFRFDS